MLKSRRRVRKMRELIQRTPDITKPDAWFPLDMDSDEFKRGARWAESWWRAQVGRILDE